MLKVARKAYVAMEAWLKGHPRIAWMLTVLSGIGVIGGLTLAAIDRIAGRPIGAGVLTVVISISVLMVAASAVTGYRFWDDSAYRKSLRDQRAKLLSRITGETPEPLPADGRSAAPEANALVSVRAGETAPKPTRVTDVIHLNLNQLDTYYDLVKRQSRTSFRWAIIAMVTGLFLISAGIVIAYTRADSAFAIGVATGVAGGVAEFIGYTFLRLHSRASFNMVQYHHQLLRTQDAMLAIELSREMDPEMKNKATLGIIHRLMENRSPQTAWEHPRSVPVADPSPPK